MEMPAGIAATLDRLAAIVGSHATITRGVPDRHGPSETDDAPARESPVGALFPPTRQDVHPAPDLRA